MHKSHHQFVNGPCRCCPRRCLTAALLTAALLTLPLGQAPPSAFMTGLLGQPGRRGAAPGQPPVPRTGFSRLVSAATWLFTVAAPVPFLLDTAGLLAVAFLAAALPARSRIPGSPGTTAAAGASRGPASPDPPSQVPRATWRASMREGLAWLAGHRPLRALAVTVAVSNLGLGALFAVSCCSPGSGWVPARWVTGCCWP